MIISNSTEKVSNYKLSTFIYLILFFWLAACKNPTAESTNKQIDQILTYDKYEPLTKEFISTLDSTRQYIDDKDVDRLTKFYRRKQEHTQWTDSNINRHQLYADSAIALFNEHDLILQHKQAYLDALLLKGEALFASHKYEQAVFYFLEALSFRKNNLPSCENRIIYVRLADIYFVQGKFLQSARCYRQSYELEVNCNYYKDPLKKFYEVQSLLNNAGFCYEKTNMLDSAQYFYQKDLDYLETNRNNPKIGVKALHDAATTVLDNLGSIYLKKGNLVRAEDLLKKSIKIKYSGDESVVIPPLIKLTSLYTLKHDFKAAEQAFRQADTLLSKITNVELESRWNKSRSEFYNEQGKHELAYNSLQRYLVLRDSINRDKSRLSSIDIDKDFINLEQNYNLQNLEKKEALKNTYLIFILSFLLLVLVVAFLMFRNVKLAKKNNQMVERHNQKLQETLLKLEDANQNYARVMKVMAHDLRNPLSGIAGISSFLLEEHQPIDEKESLAIIKTSADNALGLINELLNSILTTNQGVIELKKKKFNIQLLLQQCVSLLSFKANEKQQNILIHNQDDIFIDADADKLWRVFNNLIVNAIKFSHKESTITIDIQNELNQVIITIADRGIGIPKDIEEKIFELFTEAKRIGTAGEKPYGLGLSISKQIVEGHGGKIWVEPNPDGGSIFFIQLPK